MFLLQFKTEFHHVHLGRVYNMTDKGAFICNTKSHFETVFFLLVKTRNASIPLFPHQRQVSVVFATDIDTETEMSNRLTISPRHGGEYLIDPLVRFCCVLLVVDSVLSLMFKIFTAFKQCV